MCSRCFRTVLRSTTRTLAISAFERPSATQSITSHSRRVNRSVASGSNASVVAPSRRLSSAERYSPVRVRAEQTHHDPLAKPELTLAAEIDRGEASPRGIEINQNLVASAVVAKVEIELGGSPLVPVEDVSEHDDGSPSVCVLVPTKLDRSGTFPPAVVYRHRRFRRRCDVAALHAHCMVDFAEAAVLAADDLDQAVQ